MTKFNSYILKDVEMVNKKKKVFNFSLKLFSVFSKESEDDKNKTRYEDLFERWEH